MDRAILAWLCECSPDQDENKMRANSLKLSYTLYGCMVLLPSNAFETPAWQQLQRTATELDFETLYDHIARHLKVTHIAINKPIPALDKNEFTENIVRLPSNFMPLYGDFGPDSASSPPTASDFDEAFWVIAKQNGIFQTWAPRWTMFSRGNVSEKARLLSLPSVKAAVEQGGIDGRGSTAVDLYAGIGYFAFSYLKAGVEKVLCWDLNPWSTEGLRRGAAANKWPVATYYNDECVQDLVDSEARLVVFNESNERALDRMRDMHGGLPPIRHVNCGLLPTSRGSWQTALEILNPELGGWVHVHENLAVAEIEQKAEETRKEFQKMVFQEGRAGTARIEYVNRLKSYAPGVMHCVLDLYIPPNPPVE